MSVSLTLEDRLASGDRCPNGRRFRSPPAHARRQGRRREWDVPPKPSIVGSPQGRTPVDPCVCPGVATGEGASTMLSQFDDLLLVTADDGASAPVVTSTVSRAMLANEIMEAWYQERHDRIETGLFLDQARNLLGSILT